jgi:hypothetical protein
MSMSEAEILRRIASGERLRWVPCSMLGVKTRCKTERMLRLGNDTLSDCDGLKLMDVINSGRLVATEREDGICDYELIDGENKQ